MLFKLINSIFFNFYKTKWTERLTPKVNKKMQVPFRKWTIVNGDFVKIRAGPDRGKVGKVVKVLRRLNRIVVRGVNIQ